MGAVDRGTRLRPVQALLLLSVVSTAAGRALFHPPHRLPLRDGEIPRVIHQSWKTGEVPAGMARWQASWRAHHADWEYRLWDDEDNERLVHDYYPWRAWQPCGSATLTCRFREVYDALPRPVMKADACRYLYMHHVGGVYADMDFEALRSLGPLLAGQQLLLAAMSADAGWDQAIPNAWMASAPRHPFWLFTLAQVIKAAGANLTAADRWDWLEATTGPVMLHAAVKAYRAAGGHGLTVLEPGVIYPVDWRDTISGPRNGDGDAHSACNPLHARFNDTACKLRHPGAFAITYWTHSWGR